MASGLAPKLPLALDETDGAYALLKDYVELVKQNLKMLLLTAPGERVMDTNFGVGLRNYLFEPNKVNTFNEVAEKIQEQISRYMSYIEINDIKLKNEENMGNGFFIELYFTIIPLGISELLSLPLNTQ